MAKGEIRQKVCSKCNQLKSVRYGKSMCMDCIKEREAARQRWLCWGNGLLFSTIVDEVRILVSSKIYKKERAKANRQRSKIKHPHKNAYECMVQRCTNPNHPKYYLYGAKGIVVEWDYGTFCTWAKTNLSGKKVTHRVNSKGNYSAANCIGMCSKDHSVLHWLLRKYPRLLY